MLVALGFRESDGSVLSLPQDTDMYDLAARKLELEVGLDILKKRIALDKTSDLKARKIPASKLQDQQVPTPEVEAPPLDSAR